MSARSSFIEIRSLMLVTLLGLSSGCATMSDDECLIANWEEVGYHDAIEGYPPERASEHQEACADVSVPVDFELYRHGHSLGLPYYCTETTGFETADHGGEYATQCEPDKFGSYATGYRSGREVYALKLEIRQLDSLINERNDQTDALMSQIGQLRTEADDSALSKSDRREAREQASKLEDIYRTLNQDIDALSASRDQLNDEMQLLVSTFYSSI